MRVLINREPVGWHLGLDFQDNDRDFWAGRRNCEDVVLELMQHLGWLEDLRSLVDELPGASAEMLKEALRQHDAQKCK